MGIIYLFVSKTFAVLNIIALIFTIYYPVLKFYELYLINLIMVAFLFVFYKIVIKGAAYLPLYIALLLPGAGTLLFCLMDMLAKDMQGESVRLAEYREYIKTLSAVNEARALSVVDVASNVNVLSGIDELKYSTAQRKKDLILNIAGDHEEKAVVAILKKAISDSDPDIKHYAATTLIGIEEKFEKNILKLKEQYKQKPDAETALKIMELYDRYIHSGVLDENYKKTIFAEYLELLRKSKNMFADSFEISAKLLHAYLELRMFERAEQLLAEFRQLWPEQGLFNFLAMDFYFRLNDYKQVASHASRIKESGLELPDEYKQVVNYWS